MKLLWVSNAPWAPSGYGSQTRQVGPRIARAGVEVEFLANDRTRGDQEWEGFLVRGSSGNDIYSRDSLREDYARSRADWLLFLYDAWVFTEGKGDPFEAVPRVAGWVPVDHFPTPLSLHGWLAGGHLPIAMSRFGKACLEQTSRDFVANGMAPFPVLYAPHAVDPVFRPSPSDFRASIDVPEDAYLVGIVAANNGSRIYDRKGFGDMAHALAMFMDDHKDAYLYVHTIQQTFDGIDLPLLFAKKAIDPARVRWADQYELKKQSVTDAQMAERYSAMDVLLATSRGEGFGLPVLEGQACGTPVIASNWTAQAELVGEPWAAETGKGGFQRHPNGWLVAVDPDWDPRHAADFAKPLILSIYIALGEAYQRRGDQAMSDAAIAKASEYGADLVFDRHWRPILEQLEAGLHRVAAPANRAARRQKARKKVVA